MEPTRALLTVVIIVILGSVASSLTYLPPIRPYEPCNERGCFPQTGNLLIGREDNLTASSTCGMHGEERYCVISHVEDRRKCYLCDSSDETYKPTLNHRIKNIVYRNVPGTQFRSWWQSENGVENVSIQLNLGTVFDLTHIIMFFKSFRPAALFIERSSDWGTTWKAYGYFAYNCEQSFPGIPMKPASATDAFCDSRYTGVTPSTEGEVLFRVVPKMFTNSATLKEIQELQKITNLRINLTKMHNFMRQQTTEKYFAIYEIILRGSCSCNGHSSRCVPMDNQAVDTPVDMVHGQCACLHNTKGAHCEQCVDGFYLQQERKIQDVDACASCDCDPSGSMSNRCDTRSGQCQCKQNMVGRKCDQIASGIYGEQSHGSAIGDSRVERPMIFKEIQDQISSWAQKFWNVFN